MTAFQLGTIFDTIKIKAKTMKAIDIIAVAPFVVLVAIHNAWRSFEFPLLMSVAVLVCIIIKSKSNEQRKKKKH